MKESESIGLREDNQIHPTAHKLYIPHLIFQVFLKNNYFSKKKCWVWKNNLFCSINRNKQSNIACTIQGKH